jgi:hypothetical protein
MIRRPDAGRRTPVGVAVALTWTGSGAMFAYALLTLAAVVTGAPESDNVTALNGLTQLAALLGGLLIAVTGVVNLAERRPPAVDPDERDTPVTRKTPPGAATRPDRVRPPDWFGYAATAVTGGLALAACRWTVTGSGYPFGPSDPLDAMSLIRGLPAGVGAPLFAGVLAVTAVAMLAMTASGGARPRGGGARVGLMTVGWTAAAVLLAVVPDIRLLALTAYAPMLLLGAPSGWADINYDTILTASMAYQGGSLLGGLLVAATVLVWQRRTRGACARCGRTDATTPARWRPAAAGRWATGVAVAVPLLFAVTRYAWMVGVPLGIGDGALRHLQETDGRWRGGGLATFAVIGAVLTLGLARPWGRWSRTGCPGWAAGAYRWRSSWSRPPSSRCW